MISAAPNKAHTHISKLIRNPSIEQLAGAVRENFCSLMKRMVVSSNWEWSQRRDLTYMITDFNVPMFNRVTRTRLTLEKSDQRIMDIIAMYSLKGKGFTWMLSPKDTPHDLPARLEKAGMMRYEGPGMAIELNQIKQPAAPKGLEVERVEGRDRLELFCDIMIRGYPLPDIIADDWKKMMVRMGVDNSLRHYIGHLDGEPVATSTILLSDGVAGLYMVATLPEARGKGVGSHMTIHPFKEAEREGYRFGILHKTRMGYNVYRKLGFQDSCKMISYEWNP
jgi:GNAT superfamily N-acetyltransferase